jgi:hypothetical protein
MKVWPRRCHTKLFMPPFSHPAYTPLKSFAQGMRKFSLIWSPLSTHLLADQQQSSSFSAGDPPSPVRYSRSARRHLTNSGSYHHPHAAHLHTDASNLPCNKLHARKPPAKLACTHTTCTTLPAWWLACAIFFRCRRYRGAMVTEPKVPS